MATESWAGENASDRRAWWDVTVFSHPRWSYRRRLYEARQTAREAEMAKESDDG